MGIRNRAIRPAIKEKGFPDCQDRIFKGGWPRYRPISSALASVFNEVSVGGNAASHQMLALNSHDSHPEKGQKG